MSVLQLTAENFEQEVLQSDKSVLVDFWAAWCGPCKMIAPVVEELAGEMEAELKVAKLNVDEYGDIPARYGIMSIPTLILFKGGEEAERLVGYKTKEELLAAVQKSV
ncbi:thioredoxin [Metallumcola ferriviriculae]|uniref:Thioredoxin n=1 Tax=Metallumcola ferriviriculae TaxID=3039180 RepID=A0AAU0US13_9FIRM|nr:thioredoxin [Desulfitibacteraceae bacterium MK1]